MIGIALILLGVGMFFWTPTPIDFKIQYELDYIKPLPYNWKLARRRGLLVGDVIEAKAVYPNADPLWYKVEVIRIEYALSPKRKVYILKIIQK